MPARIVVSELTSLWQISLPSGEGITDCRVTDLIQDVRKAAANDRKALGDRALGVDEVWDELAKNFVPLAKRWDAVMGVPSSFTPRQHRLLWITTLERSLWGTVHRNRYRVALDDPAGFDRILGMGTPDLGARAAAAPLAEPLGDLPMPGQAVAPSTTPPLIGDRTAGVSG